MRHCRKTFRAVLCKSEDDMDKIWALLHVHNMKLGKVYLTVKMGEGDAFDTDALTSYNITQTFYVRLSGSNKLQKNFVERLKSVKAKITLIHKAMVPMRRDNG